MRKKCRLVSVKFQMLIRHVRVLSNREIVYMRHIVKLDTHILVLRAR